MRRVDLRRSLRGVATIFPDGERPELLNPKGSLRFQTLIPVDLEMIPVDLEIDPTYPRGKIDPDNKFRPARRNLGLPVGNRDPIPIRRELLNRNLRDRKLLSCRRSILRTGRISQKWSVLKLLLLGDNPRSTGRILLGSLTSSVPRRLVDNPRSNGRKLLGSLKSSVAGRLLGDNRR